jgi:voltage-gated potassium channel
MNALIRGCDTVLGTHRVGRRIAHEVRGPEDEVRVEPLVLQIVAGVTVFALADLLVARRAPKQFVDLGTKTDAVYFALTTLATVGYGDIHAKDSCRGNNDHSDAPQGDPLRAAVRTTIRAIMRRQR